MHDPPEPVRPEEPDAAPGHGATDEAAVAREAASVFAGWYERRCAGAAETGDELCAAHPAIASRLRVHLRALELADEALAERGPPLGLPSVFGPYRVLHEIGSGGMGTVLLAEGPDGAPVALKVLHPHLVARESHLRRFLREAEVGRRVVHDNVVRALGSGVVDEDGRTFHYLALEYVGGRSLRDLLDDLGRVPEALCRFLAAEIAHGLAAVHAVGAVHRDVKPDNVLLSSDHRVRLTDLGIAYLDEAGARLTRSGSFVGSLAYAAPEQFRGRGPVDGRADQYALGVTLYEISAGRHPFGEGDPAAAMRRILFDPPPPLRTANPRVTPFFAEVVHTLLTKDPSGRFPSDDVLVETLERGEASAWWAARAGGVEATEGADDGAGAGAADVRESVLGRASKLDAEGRAILGAAACAGRTFDGVAVAGAVGVPVLAALVALASIERASGLVRAAGARFEFESEGAREVVAELVAPERAAALRAALRESGDAPGAGSRGGGARGT